MNRANITPSGKETVISMAEIARSFMRKDRGPKGLPEPPVNTDRKGGDPVGLRDPGTINPVTGSGGGPYLD